jgi:hypothetical protein
LLAIPTVVIYGAFVFAMRRDFSQLVMLLPGVIAMPVYSIIPCLGGGGIPLSRPTEEAKGAGRGILMMVAMFFSMALTGVAMLAQATGTLALFLGVETIVATVVFWLMRSSVNRQTWKSLDD